MCFRLALNRDFFPPHKTKIFAVFSVAVFQCESVNQFDVFMDPESKCFSDFGLNSSRTSALIELE